MSSANTGIHCLSGKGAFIRSDTQVHFFLLEVVVAANVHVWLVGKLASLPERLENLRT